MWLFFAWYGDLGRAGCYFLVWSVAIVGIKLLCVPFQLHVPSVELKHVLPVWRVNAVCRKSLQHCGLLATQVVAL